MGSAPFVRLFFGLVALLLAPGCRRPAGAPSASRDLTVFAASSLREVFQALSTRFEAEHLGTHVRLALAGSQELRLQIEQGARPDLFASADARQMSELGDRALVWTPRPFARNEPVLVVPAGNPARLSSFADLPSAARIVIGAPEVPIGAYTLRILGQADRRYGSAFAARVLAHVASRELNVRQVLAKVTLGEADAGIVYRTDARAAGSKVTAIAIPPEINASAAYLVAVTTGAREPVLARAWVDLLLGDAGRQALSAAGFEPPAALTAAR